MHLVVVSVSQVTVKRVGVGGWGGGLCMSCAVPLRRAGKVGFLVHSQQCVAVEAPGMQQSTHT